MRPETRLNLSRAQRGQLATVSPMSLGSLGNPGCNDEFMANDRSAVSSAASSETRDFTSESTWRTLRLACETVGLNSAGATLLRLGSNANFSLASAPVLVFWTGRR